MEQSIDIDPIVTKYLREEALSAEEQTALDNWISQGQGRSQMLENLKNDTSSTKANLLQMEHIPHSRIWDTLVTRLQQDGYWREEEATAAPMVHAMPSTTRRTRWRYVMAASVLLIAAGSAWWGLHRSPAASTEVVARPAQPVDVAPG
ncbi:MAG TPA: hypothetical protein VKQ52_05835, partial [Puia sp.]|nr:hypothetical protein [Puia sp.]